MPETQTELRAATRPCARSVDDEYEDRTFRAWLTTAEEPEGRPEGSGPFVNLAGQLVFETTDWSTPPLAPLDSRPGLFDPHLPFWTGPTLPRHAASDCNGWSTQLTDHFGATQVFDDWDSSLSNCQQVLPLLCYEAAP